MNAQYRKNLKTVLEASKTYCDESVDNLRWELGTYDLSVDSDTTSAYQKSVPANSIEAKINTLGGMSYKCNNLFSLDNTSLTIPAGSEQWYFISNETLKSMGLINGNTYTIKGNNAPSSIVYQKLPNYNGFDTNAVSFTMDDNITLRIGNNTIPQDVTFNLQIMLNEGSTALPYEPYYSGIRDTAPTSVESVGANLAGGTIIENQAYGQTGATYSTNDSNIMTLLLVEPNTIYSKNNDYWINCYDINQNFIEQLGGLFTFTTPNNCYYVGITIPKTTPNLMLNYGSTAQAYKPYTGFTASLLIPAQVQALDGYGWGINSTCYNYIDFNSKKFIKKVGRVDLGSLDWAYASGETYPRFAVVVSGFKMPTSDTALPNVLCAKYDGVGATYLVNLGTNGIALYSNQIFIRDTNYTDATAFKTAMSGVYLYYELATPVETDISAYLTTNKITVEGGGTLTAENTYGASVPSDIDYLKEVAK